jgi:hypothetical protein
MRKLFVGMMMTLVLFGTGCNEAGGEWGLLFGVWFGAILVGITMSLFASPLAAGIVFAATAISSAGIGSALPNGHPSPPPPPSHVAPPPPPPVTHEHVAAAPAGLEEDEGSGTPLPPLPWSTSWNVVTHEHDGADYLGGPVELGRTRTPLHALNGEARRGDAESYAPQSPKHP